VSDAPETPTVQAIEIQAAHWAQRRHFWPWSTEDQLALDAWLETSSAHRVAFVRMNAALLRTKRLAALQSIAPRRSGDTSHWLRSNKIAAAFIVAAVMAGLTSFTLLKPQGPTQTTYSTPKGGRQTIAFSDGSRVELNTDTVLRIEVGAKERHAWLDKGEAYFQIQHDAARPFVVTAGARRITDLGTKFLLRRDHKRLEVSLLEGRIKLDAQSGKKFSSTNLEPGETAIVTPDKIEIRRKSQAELVTKLGWRRGVVTFDQTTIADAIAEFNRYNKHKLVVGDSKAARITIGGTFDVNNVETFIDIARQDFGLHAVTQGDETVLSK